jgi:hypothetical protein
MKKMKALAILGLFVVVSWMGCRYMERGRLLRGLDKKAKMFDAQLAKIEHHGDLELMNAARDYLNETAFVLTKTGLLFGTYFSRPDKQTLLDNASKRLLRLKETFLNNPSFKGMQKLPDLALLVDLFFEKIGFAANFKKDQVTLDIINRWTSSGERAKIYFSEEEKNMQLSRSIKDYWDDLAEEARTAKKKQEAAAPVIPGMEEVLEQKQRQVTRVTREPVTLAELDKFKGQELNFLLKSGRQISGLYSGRSQQRIAIGFFIEGNSLTTHVGEEEIEKIEKVTVKKVLEMYDPTMERENALKSGFLDLDFLPYPRDKNHVAFITPENKMVFVSIDDGSLTCHSRENAEGYKPMATRIQPNWLRKLVIREYKEERRNEGYVRVPHTYSLMQMLSYRPADNRKASDGPGIYISNKGVQEDFNLVFQLRLVKRLPGASAPIIIYHQDLILNEKTVRLMFVSENTDQAIFDFGNPKFGKGPLPWEYELKDR